MRTSLNVGVFQQGSSVDRMIAETARAGFDAIELTITTHGPLTFEASEHACIHISKQAADAGLTLSALAVEDFGGANFASPDPADRRRAHDRALIAFDLAAWLGTDAVMIAPAVVWNAGASRPAAGYEDAYSMATEALLALRFEAAQRAIRIACEVCRGGFLLSPMETRGFIDRINSPWVGACLDPARVMPFGYPQDWIRVLARRLVRVYFTDFDLKAPGLGAPCALGDGHVRWPEVLASLKQIHYDGPATCRGEADPVEAGARLGRVLQLSPPGATVSSQGREPLERDALC